MYPASYSQTVESLLNTHAARKMIYLEMYFLAESTMQIFWFPIILLGKYDQIILYGESYFGWFKHLLQWQFYFICSGYLDEATT